MSETIQADVTIDARGATCPGPLMDLIGKIKTADVGTVIDLQTRGTSAATDGPEWVEKAGHELVDIVDQGDYTSLYVEKTA